MRGRSPAILGRKFVGCHLAGLRLELEYARIQRGLVREIDAAVGTDRGIVGRTALPARWGAVHPIAAIMRIRLRRSLRTRQIIFSDEDLCCFSRGPRERLEFVICRPRSANLGQKSDDV